MLKDWQDALSFPQSLCRFACEKLNQLCDMFCLNSAENQLVTANADVGAIFQYVVLRGLDALAVDKHAVVAVLVKDQDTGLDAFEKGMVARGQVIAIKHKVIGAGPTHVGGLAG